MKTTWGHQCLLGVFLVLNGAVLYARALPNRPLVIIEKDLASLNSDRPSKKEGRLLVEAGEAAVREKKFSEAEQYFSKALTQPMRSARRAETAYDLSFAQAELGHIDRAIEAATVAANERPGNASYLLWLGALYERVNMPNEALRRYEEAFKLGKNDAAALAAARVSRELFWYEKGMAWLDQVSPKDRGLPAYERQKTQLLFELGRYEEAYDVLAPLALAENATIDDQTFLFGLACLTNHESVAQRIQKAHPSFPSELIELASLSPDAFLAALEKESALRVFVQRLVTDSQK